MTLMDFYDKVEDQFTPEALKKLLDYYANGDYSAGIVYNASVYTNGVFEFNSEDYLNYIMNMFNRFKKHLLNIKRGDRIYIQESEIDLLSKLRRKLLDMPEYSNWEEFIEARKTVLDLEDKKYRDYFDDVEKNIGMPFILSWYMNRSYVSNYDLKHRLYLNVENIPDGEKIINYLMNRCEQNEVAYEFKFWCDEGRSDQIVIYSSTADLLKFVNYLEDFKNEYPEVVSRIHTPPILTGVYDGWIGYGTEPDKSDCSFNDMRSNIIELELDKILPSGVDKAITKKYDYNGEMVSLEDYITYNLIDVAMSKNFYFDNDLKFADNCRDYLYNQIKTYVINNLKNASLSNDWCHVDVSLENGEKEGVWIHNFNNILVGVLKDDETFISSLYDSIKDKYNENGILEKSCFDGYVLEEMKEVDFNKSKNDTETKILYDDKLNEEFLKLLQELKKPSYDRKERSKFVVRIEQIIDIYRNDIHNDEFADTLVKAFNNAQAVYERELSMKDSVSKGKNLEASKPKHFKKIELSQDKSVSLSKDMESKIDEESLRKVQAIDDKAYKMSSQKVDEMLDKKMAEIYERVDNGETLDSKIDDLSRYVNDLNKRRAEINEQFKDAWVLGDEDKFDKLLSEDNRTKALISENQAEIERRIKIRDIVDEQIAREEVTQDLERYASDVDFVNNSNLTDEQKKIIIDGIYAEFDKYVEEHPEDKERSR